VAVSLSAKQLSSAPQIFLLPAAACPITPVSFALATQLANLTAAALSVRGASSHSPAAASLFLLSAQKR
jgi:hypothetical protein